MLNVDRRAQTGQPLAAPERLWPGEVQALKSRLERLTGSRWTSAHEEPELHAQAALLRNVLDESPDFIVLKDHEGRFLLGNRPLAEFYGTTPEQMVGKDDGDFGATPEQNAFFRRNVLAIMASGQTETVLEDCTDPRSGQLRHFRSIKKPFVGADGRPRILVIAQDITDMRNAQQLVQESERRLSWVLDVTGEGVWDWDLPRGTLQHNRRWYELLGYAEGELSGRVDDFQACLFEPDRQEVAAAVQRCLDGHGPYRHEHRMRRKDGSTIWVLDRGDVVERAPDGTPLRMVGSFADVSERKAAEAMTEQLAFYDPLTGLPNRRLMLDRLEQAIQASQRTQQQGALLFIDLDNFKDLNDCRGHAAGDALLQRVAQRLRGCVRQIDTAARIGGDEFVLILEGLGLEVEEAAHSAEAVAGKVLRSIALPYEIDGQACCSTPSIGIALFGALQDSAPTLLKRADFAMYQAKDAGRNTWRFYDPAMQETVLARSSLASRLRRALDEGELCIHLQPVVDENGHRVGAEALVRWNDPERGLVPPAEFIALAEQTGLILQMGQQVLQLACRQLVAWRQHPSTRHLTMAVNVSARQFRQPDFVQQVAQTLVRTGAEAQLLKLEITESMLLDDVAETIAKMTALREQGVRFSIDDFGTGYSSLAYLKRLPLDELKIDRSFVNDVLTDAGDANIVQTILVLARSLGLKVVAEGVETAAQLDFLVSHGCRLFQGFLFGRPMPQQDWPGAAD